MRLDSLLICKVKAGRRHCTGNHFVRLFEEVLIMRTALAAKGHHECGLPAATSTPAPLSVVGRRWRDIPQVDDSKVPNINAKLHRWRTEQGRKIAFAEPLFALLPLRHWYLAGVSRPLNAGKVPSSFTVEMREEVIDSPFDFFESVGSHPLGSHRVRRRRRPVAESPLNRRSQELNSLSLSVWGRYLREVLTAEYGD